MQEEGWCLGMSSGINVAGAMRLARELGPGHNIVTILCDSGTRYSSKLFNASFLEKNSLPRPEWFGTPLSEDVVKAMKQMTIPENQTKEEHTGNYGVLSK